MTVKIDGKIYVYCVEFYNEEENGKGEWIVESIWTTELRAEWRMEKLILENEGHRGHYTVTQMRLNE